MKRIAVIGGGVTGLAAAYRLSELSRSTSSEVQITLYEASSRLGGIFGSERIGDYLIERGADSFITNKPAGIELCRRLGIEDRLVSTNPTYRRSLILYQGKPIVTPEGFNLIAPEKVLPFVRSPFLTSKGKWRALSERWRNHSRLSPGQDESVAEFVSRHFGQELLERMAQPMVGGIYTSDPALLSMRTTLNRFVEMEAEHGSVLKALWSQKTGSQKKKKGEAPSGARYSLFVTPRGGTQELFEALEKAIQPAVQIRRQIKVASLARTPAGKWQIETDPAEVNEFDAVVLAISAPQASRLLESVNSECAQALQQIEHASSALVVTGHNLSDFDHPMDAFGLVIPHIEGRRILAVSFLSRKFDDRAPEGKIILRTFVGGAMQPEEYDRSDDQIVNTVLAELSSIFGLKRDPHFALLTRYPSAMPQFHVGHLNRVDRVRSLVETVPHFELAGNYLSGVGIPDCIASGNAAAERVWAD